ncbi:MAG: twin-arginine translocase TatA/TatE family subunit [Solirubrobacteraceae bacterium]
MGLDNPLHIAFLLILLLLVFGAKRLPEMGRSLGDGMRGFKDAISGETPTAQPMAQPVLAAQQQTQEAVEPVQQAPAQQAPAAVQVLPTPQPVREKLPA